MTFLLVAVVVVIVITKMCACVCAYVCLCVFVEFCESDECVSSELRYFNYVYV